MKEEFNLGNQGRTEVQAASSNASGSIAGILAVIVICSSILWSIGSRMSSATLAGIAICVFFAFLASTSWILFTTESMKERGWSTFGFFLSTVTIIGLLLCTDEAAVTALGGYRMASHIFTGCFLSGAFLECFWGRKLRHRVIRKILSLRHAS